MPSPASSPSPSSLAPARHAAAHARHWRRSVRLTLLLLVVWAVAGLGCGVLFADWLAGVHLGGFPLGFWFAQQGAIVVFVGCIFAYAVGMAVLDRRLAQELAALPVEPAAAAGDAATGGGAR